MVWQRETTGRMSPIFVLYRKCLMKKNDLTAMARDGIRGMAVNVIDVPVQA